MKSEWVVVGRRPKFPTEAWVKKQVKAMLEKLGAWYFMPYGAGMGRAGIPDFVVCIKGYFVGIEAKKSSGKLSDLQKKECRLIANALGITFIVDENGLCTLWDDLTSGITSSCKGGMIDLRGADDKTIDN